MAGPAKIGINHSGSKNHHDGQIKAFKDGLAFFGITPAPNIINKYAHDDLTVLAQNASDLVNNDNVDVLVAAGGSASAQAAQNATSTKPIVFTSVSDPTRPAPNMTGICARTTGLDVDRLNLLHELMPAEAQFGVLLNKLRFNKPVQIANLDGAAALLGLALDYREIDPSLGTTDAQIDQAFQSWANKKLAAALVAADPLFNNHRARVVGAQRRAIYQWREFAEAGGLISYGQNLTVAYKLAGYYVGRILGGAAPASLPVLPLNSFEIVLNLKTARDVGLNTIPPTILARVDDIIV